MNFITAENISKSFGEKILFDKVSLKINKGDKIGLIAKNGSGKTTLLRVLAGEFPPEGENAELLIARDLRIAFLDQDVEFNKTYSILEELLQVPTPAIAAYRKYREAESSGNEDAQKKANLLMDDTKAWDTVARITGLCETLLLPGTEQRIGTLSGGQKKRVALAKVILQDADFLILDEPTNHLDIDIIEWLEEYLSQSQLAILMVTHDRYFLDRVCNQIIELENTQLHTYRGNYADYLEKKMLLDENRAMAYNKLRQRYNRELDWVRRMPKARTTKSKSRVQQFHEIRVELRNIVHEDTMRFHIDVPRLGSKILEFHNVSLRRGDRLLLEHFNYKFKRDDRVAVIGPNGAGKSSFAQLITGELKVDTGKLVHGDTLRIGYFQQEGLQLPSDKRVIEVIRSVADYIPLKGGKQLTAEQLLENFLFPRSQQQVYFSQLSGGEKRRVYLLTILMQNPNFLILDEPTNDLDIPTLQILEEFLLDFDGVLLIISHDRYLLDKLVDHSFIFYGTGRVDDFPGSYSQYLEARQQAAAEKSQLVEDAPAVKQAEGKVHHEKRKKLKRLEKEIESLEKERKDIQEAFLDPGLALGIMQEMQSRLEAIDQKLEGLEDAWMGLSEQFEKL